MRVVQVFFVLAVLFVACDDSRVYEKYNDFGKQGWLVTDTVGFNFQVNDTTSTYNLYCNVRNSVSYPYSRLFFNYYLQDNTGRILEKRLQQTFLFDQQTGKPEGKSGLGDIYDQRVPLKTKYKFSRAGKYRVWFEQYMRKDTLEGILAVGLRVERAVTP
jgi:gliding motility-associated lipoprotein GldH